MTAVGTSRTSRSRPEMSVHGGEAVKATPRWKWRYGEVRVFVAMHATDTPNLLYLVRDPWPWS